MSRTAEVAVFAGLRGPARTFTYRIPDGLDVRPGHLVRAGFGTRAVHGVVVALDVPSDRELKPLDGLVHPVPLLSARQLALARWIAATYRCGLADAVRAMLPPALAARARGGLPAARGERTEPVFAITAAGHTALAAMPAQKLGARQLVTLRALAAGAVTSADLADAGGTAAAATSLAARGLALRGTRGVRRVPAEFRLSEADLSKDMPATAPQAAAIAAVIGALGTGRGFLLHGVTGSGKTEVYLRLTAEALARGQGAIVLVPEIALTAQVVARFVARFGERVALLHSALSAGERYDEWRRILDGVADVVVGSRSALFAPIEDLGLIVVDEEQEPSYKQESAPRYHAVDTALELGRLSGAAVVLGSATPRVVTYAAATAGDITLLPLPERVLDLPLPKTTVVDLRLELKANNRSTLSSALRKALIRTVAKGEQAILYLNRRGFATVVLCRDCGYVVPCPACEIPFALHADGRLVCHRCGREEPRAPAVCPRCGSARIRHLGVGTQRVEEDVRAAVPKARLARLDRDAVKAKGAHAAMYERMRSGQAQVIVGTQMVAKGFDLPGVSLVGVVNADTQLNLPDYTAAERTFELLTQVLGRSGRGDVGGEGILQTYLPEHYAIVAAAAHDYKTFAEHELRARRHFGYPPFGRLVLLQTSAAKEATVERRATELAAKLRAAAHGDAEVLGPAPAFAAKRAGSYRAQLVLRGDRPTAVLDRVDVGAEWTVDVDPMTLLG
ncbi:MAG TPA: primosomal protein N' [Candidatus Saccharimonadales bacterium]|nr:primosomal protein N' [Candidatus Saccharimonadales bacterium]